MCQYGTPSSPVVRNYLWASSMDLRPRTSVVPIAHGGQTSYTFAGLFLPTLDEIVEYLSAVLWTRRSTSIDWIGSAGTVVCKPGMHPLGRAFDLTAMRLLNGEFVDTNTAYHFSYISKRLYLAIAAAARIHTKNVETAYWLSPPKDHIHIDNVAGHWYQGTTPPLQTNSATDMIIVQMACNILNNANIPYSGQWDTPTFIAYGDLVSGAKMNLWCNNPFTNFWHMAQFLDLVCNTACANQTAGYLRGTC